MYGVQFYVFVVAMWLNILFMFGRWLLFEDVAKHFVSCFAERWCQTFSLCFQLRLFVGGVAKHSVLFSANLREKIKIRCVER
jgi:hypothetical protein